MIVSYLSLLVSVIPGGPVSVIESAKTLVATSQVLSLEHFFVELCAYSNYKCNLPSGSNTFSILFILVQTCTQCICNNCFPDA